MQAPQSPASPADLGTSEPQILPQHHQQPARIGGMSIASRPFRENASGAQLIAADPAPRRARVERAYWRRPSDRRTYRERRSSAEAAKDARLGQSGKGARRQSPRQTSLSAPAAARPRSTLPIARLRRPGRGRVHRFPAARRRWRLRSLGRRGRPARKRLAWRPHFSTGRSHLVGSTGGTAIANDGCASGPGTHLSPNGAPRGHRAQAAEGRVGGRDTLRESPTCCCSGCTAYLARPLSRASNCGGNSASPICVQVVARRVENRRPSTRRCHAPRECG